jgi:hypothetical protein
VTGSQAGIQGNAMLLLITSNEWERNRQIQGKIFDVSIDALIEYVERLRSNSTTLADFSPRRVNPG